MSKSAFVIEAAQASMVEWQARAFRQGIVAVTHPDVAKIGTAYYMLVPLLGGAAAGIFLVSLLASGVSSSTVGTLAGQMIMQGFVGFRIPIWIRRLVVIVPAFAVVGLGIDATTALVISQVVLSITLPLPMIALLKFTRRPDLMGRFATGRLTTLNALLILQTFGVPLPSLPVG